LGPKATALLLQGDTIKRKGLGARGVRLRQGSRPTAAFYVR
jgi:hypothetical protein